MDENSIQNENITDEIGLVQAEKNENAEANEEMPNADKSCSLKGVFAKVKSAAVRLAPKLKDYYFLLAPIIVLVIFLSVASVGGLYPYGEKTISWCDMSQQLVPLFCELKEALCGESGFFLSMQNAGGMNFYGVYMFFLASPLSLLVVFVEKTDIMLFMNVLVMLKMVLASLTAAIYFRIKYKKLEQPIIIALSVFYAFCGYAMLYYQNIMWLDMVYMFPLLLLSMDRLVQKGKPLLFAVTLALNVWFCFYISYMVVVFVLLYFGLTLLFNRENAKKISVNFLIASGLACLATAFVYVPVFFQYASSARVSNVLESLKYSSMVTPIYTIVPSVISLVIVIPFAFIKNKENDSRVMLLLFVLTLVPIFIEPINKMWQTGNYMSFPSRYAFMTFFCGISVVASKLDEKDKKGFSIIRSVVFVAIILLISLFANYMSAYLEKNIGALATYSYSLWGNQNSFEAFVKYYAIALAVSLLVFGAYKLKWMKKSVLGCVLIVLVILESVFSMNVYMVSPSHEDPRFKSIMQIENVIEDDDFYRVKTANRVFEPNFMGAAGLQTVGHYTSLTSKECLYTMKKLGFSSCWTEVHGYYGTVFTDAIMSNKYTIAGGYVADAKYRTDSFSILENSRVFPLGVVTTTNLSKTTELEGKIRVKYQESLYKNVFCKSGLHEEYDYSALLAVEDCSDDEYYRFKRTGVDSKITYMINVKEKTTLYFDVFDEYNTALGNHIFNSFNVFVNGVYVNNEPGYPTPNYTGALTLGTFENTIVKIDLAQIVNEVYMETFGVYGIKENVLDDALITAVSANLMPKGDSLVGNVQIDGDDKWLFVAVPYDKGFSATVNGKRTELCKTCSGFIGVKLVDGNNDVKISFTPLGFGFGMLISLIGIALAVLFKVFYKKIKLNNKLETTALVVTAALCAFAFLLIYAFPLIINASAIF